MNYIFQSVKGMHDYLPKDTILWNQIEDILKKILYNYGYDEIKLPILEKTILFKNSIGEMTDVIGKEMYSFDDKNGSSLSLRPEGTTSCVRSVIQHKLLYHKKPKLWYHGPMFRYERPQKGRYRQFYQFGIETFGFLEPDIEIELIILINKFWKKLNLTKFLTLEINSIGSVCERNRYQMMLKDFFKKHISILDKKSLKYLDNHAIRILDSKNIHIQNLLLKAPNLLDFINSRSILNFEKLCALIKDFNIPYTVNYKLIRGLDYYNNTVFEWKTKYLGSKNTICAGGRYDTLVKRLLGPDIPAAGLAIGMDRLLLLLQSVNVSHIYQKNIDIIVFFSDISIKNKAFFLSENIRNTLPTLKILLEFASIQFKKILKNVHKYDTKIILFMRTNNLINIYDIQSKRYETTHQNHVIQIITTIFT
ncbi:histidine--tRNA ligase [Buchnera aphidicola]|uniref:Histidine--tRNA ligase n=1 Tax=Buchnera aphidicola (Sarucallis kahawaluokalani) TaxID=1241878 RepID=A0A4D6YJC2_9GAMM|nr:histidine--tRNA ligase [Buchnera aphidicola]QCI25990.1 histidine--tRNA ligase [Buchnera aphidicola (Sarucallis kahawaluokalani)]